MSETARCKQCGETELHLTACYLNRSIDGSFRTAVRKIDAASNTGATARTVLADPRDGYPLATLNLSADEIQRRVGSFDALRDALSGLGEYAAALEMMLNTTEEGAPLAAARAALAESDRRKA